jgi:hypothetical protein
MDALRRFLAILQADLRERTRSPRFWALLVAMSIITWLCFPGPDANYSILSVSHGSRGAYSSAWVGMVLAMAYSMLLGLGGFYVVRGTVVRDIETRVWQLLVATPMTRAGFLFAKWASHMIVLGLVVLAGMCVGVVAQWVRAEDRSIDLLEMAKPLLLLSLPGLAMTSAAAIWFDLLPWLRRTAGSVVFFILWITSLSVSVANLETKGSTTREGWISDPNGIVVAARDFHRVVSAQTGKPQEFGLNLGGPRRPADALVFDWKQWTPRPMDLVGRLLWLALALGGVLLAAPLLDWAAARGAKPRTAGSHAGARLRWLDTLTRPFARGAFGVLAVAEFKLVLRERGRWWWLAAAVLLGIQAFGNEEGVRVALLLAMALPLDLLARGILREREHATGTLVFTAPRMLGRLLGVRFAVGMALVLLLTLPGLLRMIAFAPMAVPAGLVVAASLVSWGMCLGALTRNPRPFELLLVMSVYLGLQRAPLLDLSQQPQSTLLWHACALVPAWLLLAWAWPRLARR